MLIRMTLKNWMSFRDPVTFSMAATRERQHTERVPRIPKLRTKVLPIAAVFGGNASGKSNFIKALSFIKNMVTIGLQSDMPIPLSQFRLDTADETQTSDFSVQILVNDIIYGFSFSADSEAITDEKYTIITNYS
jgi:AAA15 family ATPase/GTPase